MKFILAILIALSSFFIYAQGSLNMSLQYQWKDTSIRETFVGSTYNEVWGYAAKGREYAIIGSTEGTHIFDVTDINNVDTITFIAGSVKDSSVVHRDYDTYRNYLYMVCDEGNSSLQIADLSFLPDSAPVVYDSDTLITRAHNIFIDTVSGNLYSCGGITSYQGFTAVSNSLSIYSLSVNPTAPQLVINCSFDLSFWDNDIGYIHDVYVKNDTAYCHAGNNGMYIVDFSNIFNIQVLGYLVNYVQKGYNHSGWLHESGRFYAMADETSGMDVKILDVGDLANITLVDTIGSNIEQALSMPHNPIYKEDLLYISFYEDGLYVFDTSDPNNIYIIGFYDTTLEPYISGVGNWGVYPFLPSGKILASDMTEGLFVFETSFPPRVLESDDNSTFTFLTYPNPATNQISILTTFFDTPLNYFVTNVNGADVMSGVLTKTKSKIDLMALANGIYIFSIQQQNGKVVTKKFVKN